MSARARTAPKRRYRMGDRAAQAAATRQRIRDAAIALFNASSYDEVSLELVAARAEVARKTVLRRFTSKDGLLLACQETLERSESGQRIVPVGDVDAAVEVLCARYEQTMDMVLRYVAVEARVPAVGAVLQRARESHWAWLAEVFAPYLPRARHPGHRRRVAELFGATEIYVWHAWRRRFGLSRALATQALQENLRALIERWKGASVRMLPAQTIEWGSVPVSTVHTMRIAPGGRVLFDKTKTFLSKSGTEKSSGSYLLDDHRRGIQIAKYSNEKDTRHVSVYAGEGDGQHVVRTRMTRQDASGKTVEKRDYDYGTETTTALPVHVARQ